MKYEILLDQLRDPIRLGFCTKSDAVLIKEAADAIEELLGVIQRQKEMINATIAYLPHQKSKWIPVTERLPEQNTRVIGFMAWKGITAIEYQHGKWYSIDHLQPLPNEAVTHWMPLPEPPKVDSDGQM